MTNEQNAANALEFKSGTYPQTGIYTSQMVSLMDAVEPSVYAKLISRYGKQFDNLMMLFRSMGREEAIANDEHTQWEENWIHDTLTVKSTVTQAVAKAALEVALDADYVYARVGDIITLPGYKERQVIVTAKNTGTYTITIKPVSDFAIGTITAGDTLIITNGAFSEGSDQPEGTIVGQTPRYFQAQIFKESTGLTGTQFVNQKWFKVIDDGRSLPGWYTTGISRAEYLLGLKIDGAFSYGEHNHEDLIDPVTGEQIKTTRGIAPWIRDLGLSVGTEGGFDLDMLEEVALYMKRQGIDSDMAMLLCGNIFANQIDNEVYDFAAGAGGGIDGLTKVESTLFKGNRELSMSLNIKTITRSGITIAVRPHGNWSNPKTYGAAGYNMEKGAMLFPLSTIKDAKTQVQIPNIGIKYRAMGDYSRRFETWSLKGAGGGLYVKSVDRADFYLRTHQMLTFSKANQAVLFDPNLAYGGGRLPQS
jgi:hypothetical protein